MGPWRHVEGSGERERAGAVSGDPVDYLDLGAEPTDLGLLTQTLYRDYGVRSLLCEGGPRLYGSMLAAGEVDEEFLTISPIAIGNPTGGAPRPGLVEGVAFDPAAVPRSTLVSVRRVGDYLFLRSRYRGRPRAPGCPPAPDTTGPSGDPPGRAGPSPSPPRPRPAQPGRRASGSGLRRSRGRRLPREVAFISRRCPT